ncbi:MFS transporter [Lactiplantibacillus pentosus]|uniref:MFS transporter n=1 Tax=Lactiplantibacillus pentosus TaxID=1589 RepID=UPI001B37B096|nr:MFS transporter [Lactiplantibacillus pentosus]MBQ0837045.1 MFS transporter [Lactiplantibacillus pentosus]
MKNIYVLLAGESTSQFGNNLFDIAIMWYLYRLTDNSTTIGLISGTFNALVVLNVLTGYLADRFPKTKVMMTIDGLQAILMGVATYLYYGFALNIWTLVGVAFIAKILGTVFDPAENALIPQIVPTDQLQRVNSMNQGVKVCAQLVGMLAGGSLVAFVSLADFVLINGLTFLVSLGCIVIVHKRVGHAEQVSVEQVQTRDWYAGLAYVYHNPMLRTLILLAVIVNMVIGPVLGLNIIWTRGTLHASAVVYSLAQALFIIGVVAGSILINFVKTTFKTKLLLALTTMTVAVTFMALTTMTVAVTFMVLTRSIGTTLIAMMVIGMAGGFVNVSLFTLIQLKTPGELLGRVNGAMMSCTNISMPIGIALGGVITRYVGIATVFIIGSAITLVALLAMSRVTLNEA